MRIHKIIVLVVDYDDLGGMAVRNVLEEARYPNRCIHPRVMRVESRDVKWSDEHPLNNRQTQAEAFAELFGEA